MLFGFLNVNKAIGATSADVLDRLKPMVRPDKIGHAGTLDPLASGVLLCCVGTATRLIDYLRLLPKEYRATFLLGRSSPTEDLEGEVTELVDPPIPTRTDVDRAVGQFTGLIQQRPPAFSAIKVAGRRAYQLARAGRTVELAARPVTIHALSVVEYDYPTLVLDIQCSSGTYIRALGRDIAESLSTAAVMSALVRTAIGPFHLADACDPRRLTRETLPAALSAPRQAVESLPFVTLNDVELDQVANGLFIDRDRLSEEDASGGQEFAAVDERDELAAILRRRPDGRLGPAINFRMANS